VQDKTIWLKTSESGLVEAGSNPSLESLSKISINMPGIEHFISF
jgi:hypothetical protein